MAALENIITIGNTSYLGSPRITFRNDQIKSVNGVFSLSISGDELAIDTVTAIVQHGGPSLPNMPNPREVYISPGDELYVSPDDEVYYYQNPFIPGVHPPVEDLEGFYPYGTPFKWTCDGRVRANFFVKSITRIAKTQYRIEAFSGIGLLDRRNHVGGIYTGQTFATVAAEIIKNAFPFTIAEALAEQQIYNWLPYDTARANLHRLLVAMGASIRRDENGNVLFTFLSGGAEKAVDDERIAVNGSYSKDVPCTRYEVTEHAYFADTTVEAVTLYDNTQSGGIASRSLVKFREPVQLPLTATGSLTIDESGVNYAIVSGSGTLTGKPYTHNTRIVAYDSADHPEPTPYPVSAAASTKSLRDDFTLVSLANSQNVAQRLYNYYKSASTLRAKIKLLDERVGDTLSMHDPFGDSISGFLRSVNVNASSNLLADATIVRGYVPSNQGNNVSGHDELTGSGVWTSPITGTITVILVSGGTGGGVGSAGEAAPTPNISSYNASGAEIVKARYIAPRNAKAGKGGAPGTPGPGGKVYVTTMQVTRNQQIAFACGVGGAGEVFGGAPAQAGTDTTFGSLSSASGEVSPSGYIDPINNDRLGYGGDNGIAGGNGVGWELDGETGELKFVIPDPLDVDGVLYSAGAQGALISIPTTPSQTTGRYAADIPGGYGGGAAYGANGNDGSVGMAELVRNSNNYIVGVTATAAQGGAGAAALPPPQADGYGQGGTGGNGGGGGGAVGAGSRGQTDYDAYLNATCWAENRHLPNEHDGSVALSAPTPAPGGDPSNGGQGGDGVIRIYWGG